MDPKFDAFFQSLPAVGFQSCLDYQYTPNEEPFYPPESVSLGSEYRNSTDNFPMHTTKGTLVPGNFGRMGSAEHRHITLETILKDSRSVTDEELGTIIECVAPEYCDTQGAAA